MNQVKSIIRIVVLIVVHKKLIIILYNFYYAILVYDDSDFVIEFFINDTIILYTRVIYS